MHVRTHACMHVCMHVCTYVCMYVRMHVRACMYVFACMHARMHAYMHACVCVHVGMCNVNTCMCTLYGENLEKCFSRTIARAHISLRRRSCVTKRKFSTTLCPTRCNAVPAMLPFADRMTSPTKSSNSKHQLVRGLRYFAWCAMCQSMWNFTPRTVAQPPTLQRLPGKPIVMG